MDQILRIREDSTAADSHDIRLLFSGKTTDGLHELTAALRAHERQAVCLIVHRQWQDQMRIIVNADSGTGFVDGLIGETFRLCGFSVRKAEDWAYLEVKLDIVGQPEETALSIHLVNHEGKYYYDGDGNSAIDVGMLRLSRVCSTPQNR